MRRVSRNKLKGLSRFSLTTQLIILNVAIFFVLVVSLLILGYTNSSLAEQLVSFIAVNPSLVVKGYFWTILTSAFVHLSFSHLLVNMISLFFLGSFVERLIGKKRYVWFYLISGIVASLFFVGFGYIGTEFPSTQSVFGSASDYAVGASGAIFGLAGLLAVILPNLRVLVFFVIPMRLWAAMVFLLFGLWLISALAGLPIGNTAHFGGLVVGLVYGIYLRLKYPHKVTLINRMFHSNA